MCTYARQSIVALRYIGVLKFLVFGVECFLAYWLLDWVMSIEVDIHDGGEVSALLFLCGVS